MREWSNAYYEQARCLADELGMRPFQAYCHMDLIDIGNRPCMAP